MNFATTLVARMDAPAPAQQVADPLDAAVSRLSTQGNDAERRLFQRICRDLVAGRGRFRREEIECLSGTDQALVYALALARLDGRYAPGQWERLR